MLARIAPAARPAVRAALRPAIARRGVATLEKVAYTAVADASGLGRNGRVVVPEGGLDIKLAIPKAMGGAGDGNNPEQLFSAGWASCFLSALQFGAKSNGIKVPEDLKIRVEAHIGKPNDGSPFGLAADIYAETASGNKDDVKKAMEIAHGICPYSRATRNNIEVKLHA